MNGFRSTAFATAVCAMCLLCAMVFAGAQQAAVAQFTVDPILGGVTGGSDRATMDGGGESYAVPTFRDLAQSAIMMGIVDIDEPGALDEYAQFFSCQYYLRHNKDEFTWHQYRRHLQRLFQSRKDSFRVFYEVHGTIQLGRYSFETQDFPLVANTALKNVGSMALLDEAKVSIAFKQARTQLVRHQRNLKKNPDQQPDLDFSDDPLGVKRSVCGIDQALPIYFPFAYHVRLPQPLTFDRIRMPAHEAQELVERIRVMKNDVRRFYVRFRFKLLPQVGGSASTLSRRGETLTAMMDGYITSIDVFYDPYMTQPLISVPVDNETRFR